MKPVLSTDDSLMRLIGLPEARRVAVLGVLEAALKLAETDDAGAPAEDYTLVRLEVTRNCADYLADVLARRAELAVAEQGE